MGNYEEGGRTAVTACFLFHTKTYTWIIRAAKILRILGLRPGFESGFFALFS